jgi:hypothetical protein
MTSVSVNTYTHSVVYVADNIMKSLKDILRLTGLNPDKLTDDWALYLSGISSRMQSQYLEKVQLEIFDRVNDALVVLWELDIVYGWSGSDGSFWTDTDQLRYHIRKAGLVPSQCDYRILLQLKPGAPSLEGWGPGAARSTDGMIKQSLGSTINHGGLGASAGYWRRP